MPDKTEIRNQFESLGIIVDDEILDQCESLCSKYHLTEESLVESWIAWSFNHLNGGSPTIEKIVEWENKEISKLKISTPKVQDKIKIYGTSKESLLHMQPKNATPEPTLSANNISKQNLIFTPASFSPDVYSPSTKYTSRERPGHSVASFGSTSKWSSSIHKTNIEVKEYISLKIDWKYMCDELDEISEIMLKRWEDLADYIVKKHNLQPPIPLSPNVTNESVFVGTVGVIDKTKSPLKVQLMGLFDSYDTMVELNMTGVTEYALFPGQVIAVEGTIVSNKLMASKIFCSAMLSLPPQPTLSDTIQIAVAAGPFTLSDTLSYQPLHDLVSFVKENQPNILILIGPLIDANHPKVCDGNIAESFFDYYERLIKNLIDSLKGIHTRLFMISSSKEAVGIPVYPTPPFCTNASVRNIKFYPDPSLLDIGGLVIGFTASDTIFHIGKNEISNSRTNRLARLGSHILHQQSFYPLYPCELELGLDVTLWEKCTRLPITPHILIAPSNLGSFVKDVDGCLIINPERLAKGMVGGTFACIEVRPANIKEEWTTASHVSAKIVKI